MEYKVSQFQTNVSVTYYFKRGKRLNTIIYKFDKPCLAAKNMSSCHEAIIKRFNKINSGFGGGTGSRFINRKWQTSFAWFNMTYSWDENKKNERIVIIILPPDDNRRSNSDAAFWRGWIAIFAPDLYKSLYGDDFYFTTIR